MRHLITSALPYINGVKHLGNLIGSMLPADVYARFLRQQGETVLFICGTDDHGAPAEIAAENAKQSVAEFCDLMHQKHQEIYRQFNLSFDYFGKTSTQSNQEITQGIFNSLNANGYIIKKSITQYYSIEDGRFLPDRYIIGECPHCGFLSARGDQCDQCTRLLDPTELINPKSALQPTAKLELRQTEHLFLDLPKLQSKIKDWAPTLEEPSRLLAGTIKKWLDEDLEVRGITRDLKWGIPVPLEGYEGKVFYVWFDAPNGYISITKDWAAATNQPEAWKDWWLDAKDVHYSQFMAKDNIPFHAIFWPAMILGSGQPWKMVNKIKAFNWLTYEKGKFSTSQNRGIFMDKAIELFPADYWRYYLIANAPETDDSNFSFEDFALTVNNDLADNLGNFVSRVLALVEKYFDSKVPAYTAATVDVELKNKVNELLGTLAVEYKELRFREAARVLKLFWKLGNEYITQKQPWFLAKEDKEKAGQVLADCLLLIRIYAITAWPVIPTISENLYALLNIAGSPAQIAFNNDHNFSSLEVGHSVLQKVVLIKRIEDVGLLTEQFLGKPVEA